MLEAALGGVHASVSPHGHSGGVVPLTSGAPGPVGGRSCDEGDDVITGLFRMDISPCRSVAGSVMTCRGRSRAPSRCSSFHRVEILVFGPCSLLEPLLETTAADPGGIDGDAQSPDGRRGDGLGRTGDTGAQAAPADTYVGTKVPGWSTGGHVPPCPGDGRQTALLRREDAHGCPAGDRDVLGRKAVGPDGEGSGAAGRAVLQGPRATQTVTPPHPTP